MAKTYVLALTGWDQPGYRVWFRVHQDAVLRLADSIDRGAAKRDQGRGRLFFKDPDSDEIRSCVLGAALEGARPRCKKLEVSMSDVCAEFPVLTMPMVMPPNQLVHMRLSSWLVKLNDREKISREDIAQGLRDAVAVHNLDAGQV